MQASATVPSLFMCSLLQQALFPGDSELQQLLHVFKLLGTPNEEVWPGVSQLRDWHEFPNWQPQPLERCASVLVAAARHAWACL